MTLTQLINKAKEGYMIGDYHAHRASVKTEIGEIHCNIELAQSRTSFSQWGRTSFYLVTDTNDNRKRFSKAQAKEILG